MSMIYISNYINGLSQAPESALYLDNVDPSTGKVYAYIPDSDARDVALAIQAANGAKEAWAALSIQDRSKYLLAIADKIDERKEELALAESKDNGKPLKLAREVDIPRASANMRFFATAILHDASSSYQTDALAINYTQRSPLGIVACISPWNLPLYLFTWKIAPALAAGNCVLAKPSEVTPYTAFLLGEICKEVGLPAGVLNIIHGLGAKAGNAMVEHPEVQAISFTGGTSTGAAIARSAAPRFKKLSLELGGKNPTLIFDDCEYENMLGTVMHSSFANQGQICLCGSRILVQKGIYERFKKDFVEKAKGLKVGPPLLSDSKLGAVVSEGHMNKVLSYVELAKKEGGNVLCGGERVILDGEFEGGYYLAPTVIDGLSMDCRTNQEEIFGPVVTIMSFDTEEEGLVLANSSQYGLAASVWTSDLKKAHRVAHKIEAGIVWVNTWLLRDLRTPFGGAKDSGVGREGGFHALHFFTEEKNICIKL